MMRLVLTVEGETITAELIRYGNVTWRDRRTYESLEQLGSTAADIAAGAPWRGRSRRVLVRLGRPLVQVRTLSDLPPVRRRDLVALVANQVHRFFRARDTSLVVDARWATGSKGSRVARAVAATVDTVESLTSPLVDRGFTLLDVEACGAHVPPGLSVMPPALRTARRGRAVRGMLLMLLLTAAVWTGTAGVFVADLLRDRRAIGVELDALRGPVRELLGVRREIARVARMVAVAEEGRVLRGWSVEVLAALTEALPDTAYFAEMSVWITPPRGNGAVRGVGDRAVDRGGRFVLRTALRDRLAGRLVVIAPADTGIVDRVDAAGLPLPVTESEGLAETTGPESVPRLAIRFGRVS